MPIWLFVQQKLQRWKVMIDAYGPTDMIMDCQR